MSAREQFKPIGNRQARFALCLFMLVMISGCAATRPPEVGAPRSTESPYPIYFNEDPVRREAALATWHELTRSNAATAENPELQPVTGTIRRLPEMSGNVLKLPVVGKKFPPTEEEVRESLRRFLNAAGPLVCPDREQLTLVQQDHNPGGVNSATYEQRPFRYRLRGGYGAVHIDYAQDWRVTQISSTCLPDLDQTQRDIQSLRPDPALTPEKIAALLSGKTFSPAAGAGFTVNSPSDYTISEPVIIVRETGQTPRALEFRLAWEIHLKGGFPIYLDSIDGTILPSP